MKLIYTAASNNPFALITFNESTGERIGGHFYSVSAVRRYAKRHGSLKYALNSDASGNSQLSLHLRETLEELLVQAKAKAAQ